MMTNINVKNTIEVQGDIIPDTDNTRNLGTSSVNWAETHTEDLYVYGNVVTDLVPNVSGVRDLGSSSNRWKDAYVTDLYTSGSSTFSGDISVSGSIGSDLIPNITGIQDLGSSSNRWKDAYVTDLYASGSSTLSGNVSIPGTIGSSLVPSGTQNIGSDAVRWNSLYGAYARITNNVHTGTGSTSSPAYSFEGDGDTGMFLYNSGGLKAPAIVTDGGIQSILKGERAYSNLGSTVSISYLAGLSPGSGSANVSLTGTELASITFTALSNRIFMIGHAYSGYTNVDTTVYAGIRLGATAFFGEATLSYVKASEPGANITAMAIANVIPGTQYTVRFRAAKDTNLGVTNMQGLVIVIT